MSSLISFITADVVVELDGNQLHPLLAYLGYQKSGLEAVTSHDPEGIINSKYVKKFLRRIFSILG